jgi:hypothetical protein
MAHDHHHGSQTEYYLEQLFTIGVCGALGAVALGLYYTGRLNIILHPKFHVWVLAGGISLLVLVAIRAIALWNSVEEPAAVPAHDHDHDHDHAHEHDHDHDHAHCDHGQCGHEHHHHDHDHDHDHAHAHAHAHEHGHDHDQAHSHAGHDHGWAPWRYVVLLLPVVLYLLNLPNEVFSSTPKTKLDDIEYKGDVKASGTLEHVGFLQLERASQTPETREELQGKRISLVGRFSGDDGRRFTLNRYKINCCAADAVPLKAVILIDPSQKPLDLKQVGDKWVKVTGTIVFVQKPGSNEYLTALIVKPEGNETLDQLVKVVPPDPNPYANF